MNILRTLFFVAGVGALMLFANCDGGSSGGGTTPEEDLMALLQSKTWSASANSVSVPANSATIDSDWDNFTVSFGTSTMSTNGHPTGANVVWPTGSTWTLTDITTITRGDGVAMTIVTATTSNLVVRFTMPPGTEIGGRVASLEGEYTFNLQ